MSGKYDLLREMMQSQSSGGTAGQPQSSNGVEEVVQAIEQSTPVQAKQGVPTGDLIRDLGLSKLSEELKSKKGETGTGSDGLELTPETYLDPKPKVDAPEDGLLEILRKQNPDRAQAVCGLSAIRTNRDRNNGYER